MIVRARGQLLFQLVAQVVQPIQLLFFLVQPV